MQRVQVDLVGVGWREVVLAEQNVPLLQVVVTEHDGTRCRLDHLPQPLNLLAEVNFVELPRQVLIVAAVVVVVVVPDVVHNRVDVVEPSI